MAKRRKLIDIDTDLLVVAKKEAADKGTTAKGFIESVVSESLKKSPYYKQSTK